ncbi:MAG: hypothetical protein LBF75_03730 [Treponema sp.]|jgi:hypothetical protein|nr:hypothetical protein [Treponema sp.]
MKKKYRFILVIGLLFPAVLGAGDKRHIPLELFLIIDGSSTLKNVQPAVVRWLHEQVVDSILQEGDRLTIWVTAEKGEVIFSDVLKGAGDKARIKRVLQSLPFQEGTANVAGAIRDATARVQRSRSMVYTLLISGSTTGRSPSLGGDAVGLLRFTRVEEFSGWRATVIGLGLTARVQQAAAAYMQGNP